MAKPKIMIIGLDAPIAPKVYGYAMAGKLPALKSLIDRGVYAKNCLVPYPTITSSNWTSIATGAWPGTHGITGYSVHIPGDPLDEIHNGFDSEDNTADALWNVAERVGKKSIIFDWPATWPSTISEGIVIGGGGVGINSWRVPHGNDRAGVSIGSYQLFSTENLPFAGMVKFEKANGWLNLRDQKNALQAEVVLTYDAPPQPPANDIEPKTWHILLIDTKGDGYDKVLISETKDCERAFATLSVGEWTPTIVQEFRTSKGTKKGAFKCKLLELSGDAQDFKLYVTIINALDGWSQPECIATEIHSCEGLPSPRDGYSPLLLGWIDLETLVELAEFQHIWTADAAVYLLENKEWDLFFMHAHCPDWIYHTFSSELDPISNPDQVEVERYSDVELRLYQSLDRMIGRIINCTREEAIIVVTSDHGAKAKGRRFRASDILIKEGLTALKKEAGPQPEASLPTSGDVDWSKTKAYSQRVCYIYVNLKGRDPDGIVEPGEEYERVREQVIQLLHDYTDPDTKTKPIALALRREDARILGLYGERVGDVIYALNPEFGGEHGNFLTTAGYGLGSMKGLLIMVGPGFAKGRILERTAWLTDIVPTVCYLTDLPIPRNAEGVILYQAFENPDLKLEELRKARENYQRVLRAFSSEEAETHRHGE